MGFVNPSRFTTRPEIDGTFGVVASTHWIATAVGMGDPRAWRQRLRRRGRDGLHAAGRRAASQRAGRRRADHRARRAARPDRGDLRPGPGAGGRDDRALSARSASTWCPAPACSPPACPGTFDAWMLLLRDYGTMPLADVLTPAIAYARERLSAGRARRRHHRHRRSAVPRALADLGRGLSAGRQGAGARATCSPIRRSPTPMSASCARPRAPAATATSRSSAPARHGRRASSPRRSTASAARRR